MDTFAWQRLPVGLDDIPPGPALAAALASLDPHRLSGEDLEALLVAQQRQINAMQAAQMATMLELGLRDIGPDHPVTGPPHKTQPDQYSADALRPPLVWTRRAADTAFTLAWDLQSRLSAVYAAMTSGTLDRPRAAIFSDWTMQLTHQQAHIVCDRVLPDAPRLTTGQLIERLKRECIAIDPEWAARRYTETVKTRRIIKSVNPDGTANLSGYNLPLDEAATAKATVDHLVKKAKAAGDPRPRDLISADIYLGLLSTYRTLTDAQIITDLLNRATHETIPDLHPSPDLHPNADRNADRNPDPDLDPPRSRSRS